MKKVHSAALYLVTFTAALAASRSSATTSAPDTYRIEITVSDVDLKALKSSTKSYAPQAKLKTFFEGQLQQTLDVELHSRGQSSLDFPRKNLSVKVVKTESSKEDIKVGILNNPKLIFSASPEDVLVVRNQIGYQLFQKAGVSAIQTQYAEVLLNGASQGLYMLSKHPADDALSDDTTNIVFRRRRNDKIELKDAKNTVDETETQRLAAILNASILPNKSLKGEALFNTIAEHFDIKSYYRYLAVNYLIRNGDYTDEVFFAGKTDSAGKTIFSVTPWDLDDTFAKSMYWAKIPFTPNFGKEKISAKQLLFSYQNTLDKTIARDPYLLQKYFETVDEVLNQLDEKVIASIIANVQAQLIPYLDDADILKNGELDSIEIAHTKAGTLAYLQQLNDTLQKRRAEMQAVIAL